MLEPITNKGCFWMIFLDLFINLIIGLYYFKCQELPIGMLMASCPIAISPIIFIMEFIFVSLWKNRHMIIYHIIENCYEHKRDIFAYTFFVLFPYYFIATSWEGYFYFLIFEISLYNWKLFPMNFYWKPLESWKMIQRMKAQKKIMILKKEKQQLLTDLNLVDQPLKTSKKTNKQSAIKELPATSKKENSDKISPKI